MPPMHMPFPPYPWVPAYWLPSPFQHPAHYGMFPPLIAAVHAPGFAVPPQPFVAAGHPLPYGMLASRQAAPFFRSYEPLQAITQFAHEASFAPRKRGRPVGSKDVVQRIRRFTKRAPKASRKLAQAEASSGGSDAELASATRRSSETSSQRFASRLGSVPQQHQQAQEQSIGLGSFPEERATSPSYPMDGEDAHYDDIETSSMLSCFDFFRLPAAKRPRRAEPDSGIASSTAERAASPLALDEAPASADLVDSGWLAVHQELYHKHRSYAM